MTAEENRELFLELKNYEKKSPKYLDLREKIFYNNTGLIGQFVEKYRRLIDNYASLEDMKAEANIGLLKAIDDFDIDRGIQFSTVAFRYMKTEVLRWMNRVEFRHKFDTESYDEYTNDEESTTKIELIGKPDEELEKAVNVLDSLKLRKLLKLIPKIESQAIKLKYLSGERQSARQIAAIMGVSYQRVQQIEKSAIKRLKELATTKDLELKGEDEKEREILYYLKKYESYIDLLDEKDAEILRYSYIYYPNLSPNQLAKIFTISSSVYSSRKSVALYKFKKLVSDIESGYIKKREVNYAPFKRTLEKQKQLLPYRRLIDFLPPRQREFLILRYFSGEAKIQKEMAEILGKDRRNLNHIQKIALTNLDEMIKAQKGEIKPHSNFIKRGLIKLKLEIGGEYYICRLAPRQEKVIRLRYLSGATIKSSREIAKAMGSKSFVVEDYERRALKNINEMILKKKKGLKLGIENQSVREERNSALVRVHKKLLKYLPEKQRELLTLRYLGAEIISYKQINEMKKFKSGYNIVAMERRAIENLKEVIKKKQKGDLPYLDERMITKQRVKKYEKLVDSLSRLQRDIIKTRYLSGDGVKSINEVGEILGISFKIVSRFEKEALKRLEQFVEMKRKKIPIPDMDIYRQRDLICEEIKKTPQYIEDLPKLQKDILNVRYLQSDGVKSLSAVAKELGYEKSHVGRMEKIAIKNFRKSRDSESVERME